MSQGKTKANTDFKFIYSFGANFIEFNNDLKKELVLSPIPFGNGTLKVGDKFTSLGNPKKKIRSFILEDGIHMKYIGCLEADDGKYLLFEDYNANGLISDIFPHLFRYIGKDCLLIESLSGNRVGMVDIRALEKSQRLVMEN